jgi:class 3 adenylate cyclase
LRAILFARNHPRNLERGQAFARGIYSRPWREFLADLLTWSLIGGLMAAVYLFLFHSPWLTAVKVLLGCLSFGLFGGMLSFLEMEKRIVTFLAGRSADILPGPKRVISVSKKMLFFMVTVLFFMVVTALLMIFMDINYLLAHKDLLGPEIYTGVFKEILFAFSVLLFLGLIILGRYSRNLKMLMDIQLRVMEDISKGRYQTRVPVASNDEFGLIASKTNEMIDGLRERDFCHLSFGRYVTPQVSEKILKGELTLEGELRSVTILFCDLRGYTSFVETRDPKEVVRFLNDYFAEMEGAVKDHGGIVLQYIGDEIEAVFGAPEDLPDHPRMAVLAALEMRRRLEGLNQRRRSRGDAVVAHGIGVHSGEVLAGSVGGPERLVYSMVGDAVNAASRIQALNKDFGTDILVSETTRDLTRDAGIRFTSLGKVNLRGKTRELEIFKLA